MSKSDWTCAGLFALMFVSAYFSPNASAAPSVPEHMALQPLKDLKGWSKLCTAPAQYLDRETGLWGDPVMKCVIIETPDFDDPEKHLVCDAVGPGQGYIRCGITS